MVSTKTTTGIELEPLSGTEAWRALSPAVKQILETAFRVTDYDLVAACAKCSQENPEQLAGRLFRDPEVRAVIRKHVGYDTDDVRALAWENYVDFGPGGKEVLTTTSWHCRDGAHPDCRGLLRVEDVVEHPTPEQIAHRFVMCVCACHLKPGSGN
jgi:hypothetical protein